MLIKDQKEKLRLYVDYSDWLDDYANFEDHSVGVSWLGELDEEKVKEIKDIFEDSQIVYWDKTTLILEDCGFRIVFKLVTIIDESIWTIAEIREPFRGS